MMNDDMYQPDYRAFKSNRRKRFTFYIYIILFGVILGVLLTNYLRPATDNGMSGGEKNSSGDIQTVSNQNSSAGPETVSSTAPVRHKTPISLSPEVAGFEKAVVAATEAAMPAVVSIHVRGTRVIYYNFRDPFLRMLYGNQLERKPISGMGSGVIIDPEGIVITNDHVINITNQQDIDFEKANITIQVVLADGRSFNAKVINHFPVQDIAILSIDGENLPYLEIGESHELHQGQTVLAIGNPFGDALTGGLLGSEPTVTRGIISATRRNLSIPADNITRYYRNMLQTDASINEGNSGGALIDLRGRLVGINTAILSPGGTGSIGIGFAFPADRVRLILDSVRENGDIGQWYTGIKVQDMTRQIAQSMGFEGSGVLVADIENNSPGEKSGLKSADVIIKVDGVTVTSPKEIVNIFQGAIPGETVKLVIYRNKQYKELELTVGTYQ